MKKILTTENRKKLCAAAKRAAGNTFDFSGQEVELEKDAADERELAAELSALIGNVVTGRAFAPTLYI